MAKKKKRAIALSGGGPVAGIEIGALKAFEENKIDFDIYSCACVGSWVGCLYNSLAKDNDKIKTLDKFFRDQIFIPDDIYESFPIDYKVFRIDYLNDYYKLVEKLFDFNTYKYLFLPQRIYEFGWNLMNNPPKGMDEYFYRIGEGMALNPLARFMVELQYKVKKSGIAGLISSNSFIDKYIDFKHLFKTDKIVYLNAYDLSKKELKIFINRYKHKFNDIDADALMAGSSVLHYTENKTIDGEKYKYCEGAVIDTVNLDVLLDEHQDLDEIWVVKITDYNEVTPPKNLIESALIGVMLPFDTIADDDIKLFTYRLKEFNQKNKKKIKLIQMEMQYKKVNYNWNHSNLDEGIKIGYEGTLKSINKYKKK
ncbi:MAG: patatin-like phospholipase family protein [Desulfobacteraceae bacterium]|nr:patatin-like phospholipase family protein [Desulfobacteraceae bacterium]